MISGTVENVCWHVPGSPHCAVLKKSLLPQSATAHLAQLFLWAPQTTVSEWQQAVLSFPGALGFSRWPMCFKPGSSVPGTCEMTRPARAMMETTTKARLPAFSGWQPPWPEVFLEDLALALPGDSNVWPSTRRDGLRTELLYVNVHKKQLGILVKCRFLFSRPGVGSNFLPF